MEISITGITRQRQFGKACVRLRWPLESLRGCCDEVDTSSAPFDTLQLVFIDRPEDFLLAEGTRAGDRLSQVHVGLGNGRQLRPQDDHEFLRFVADQVLRAVQQSPLAPDMREYVSARIERWRDSVRPN